MPQRRHVACAVVSAAAATTFLAFATPAWAVSTAELRQSDVKAGEFENQKCSDARFADLPDDHDGWHFILPGNKSQSGDFLGLELTFTDGVQDVTVTIPDDADPYPDAFYTTGGPNAQVKHAYLFTPAGWTLVTGEATISGKADYFNLSHTCPGEPAPSTPTPTPTPSGSVSPTPDESVSPTPDESVSPTPDESVSPTPDESTSPTPGESVTPSTSETPGGGGGGDLPLTGAAATTIALLGVGLIGGGATLMVLRRRRDNITFTS
ncbi:LPXTG cell wall anchor domain-containing protein [Micromonospora cathayae]|uniref:LPXTG cell wall anchor domain-containing protein n=1 Tax=Micromonospora cathayae TaxID=3028804 RepID=A0ABY7ZX70_9ACTN|nr:LPXTG cell wall anchor domain-containing protein [Micromonospora sp. HUAS 3]WDZ87682.1 LPXTG cell wall anchor domain-containing protein [Micromonospora sp. HUAS 3]